MSCCLVWTERATSCSIGIGGLLLHLVSILIILYVIDVFGNIELMLEYYHARFSFCLDPILHSSLRS